MTDSTPSASTPVTDDSLSPILAIRDVTKRFGGVVAVRSVSFDVFPAEILGLLGANGSGKTTLLNLISGAHRATSGGILFSGEQIAGKSPEAVARVGIGRTFQQSMTFPTLTVRENLRIVTHDTEQLDAITERLEFGPYLNEHAGALSHGMQRMLGVALALLTRPRLLLLDEPGAGLSRADAQRLAGTLAGLRDEGLTMIVVDHDMDFVLPLSDRVVVLNAGELLFTGSPAGMRQNADVQEAYLGTAA